MSATPVWFGPEGRPIFGWVHAPANSQARAGVLICPPLADEPQQTYATLRLLAGDLADREFCVLRMDYDGTGDSAGGERDPHRLAAWLSSVEEGIAYLRGIGLTSVTLVGIRVGAL